MRPIPFQPAVSNAACCWKAAPTKQALAGNYTKSEMFTLLMTIAVSTLQSSRLQESCTLYGFPKHAVVRR